MGMYSVSLSLWVRPTNLFYAYHLSPCRADADDDDGCSVAMSGVLQGRE